MPVIASQRVLFLVKSERELEWYHGKVSIMPFSSPGLEREGFLILTTPVGMIPTTYKENWHGTFRSTNPG